MIKSDWRMVFVRAYLQISPSYQLAHRAALDTSVLNADLPNDFSTVQALYADLGDVWGLSEADWWAKYAIQAIATPIRKQAHLVDHLEALPIRTRDQMDKQHNDALNEHINEYAHYLFGYYALSGFPEMILIGVPVEAKVADAKRCATDLIEAAFKKSAPSKHQPKYELARKSRLHRETLEKALFAVRARAQFDGPTLAQIGDLVDWRFDHTKWTATDKYQCNISKTNQTSELIRKAVTIAEWAARGDFFSAKPLNQVTPPKVKADTVTASKPYKPSLDLQFIAERIAEHQIDPINILA